MSPGDAKTLRLFVALPLPAAEQDRLAGLTRPLRSRLPKARWVEPRSLHLTLVFLGDTLASLLPGLDRELGAVADAIDRFRMAVGELGVFPPRGGARVVWAGLEADGDLDGLQVRTLAAAGRAVGRRLEERRPFRPHVTLARTNPPWPPRVVARLRQGLDAQIAGEPWDVSEVHLVASELRPDGPRYTTVSRYPLGAR